MPSLILDTSTDHCLIGLSKNHSLIASSIVCHGHNLSRSLLPSIYQLALESKISLKELSKISVGIGPGSYTGTRVAVAVAESLALSLSIPLYSFCSLLAFLPPELPQGPFAFISNTKHSSWFLLKGYFEDGAVKSPYSHHILSPQDTLPFLKDIPHLLSFSDDELDQKIPDSLSQGTRFFTAEPHFTSLITHLAEIEKLPPKKPEIIYIHQFQ
ncbi:MAG: tRNA (adenosine(37)-N6)-threonylcarbamoyltransferase complex dimerization subunit type 1 TsaB [Rhabdochlamydiaceae bacterium]|nr:tRNA (adenosine(37)-N6)-threonylcarbamoyltransferase complex dimerization subunit type 1 TsaB [Rhabdochlamydiaceae bacterium]